MAIQSTQLNEIASPGLTPAGQDKVPVEGRFMGAKVTQELDPMSLLADAAEELTFSLSEGEETRLDERKEKAEKKRPSDHLIELAGKQAEEADEKYGRPLNHLEQLFKLKNNAALAELMDALKQALNNEKEPDPADEFILLAGLKNRLGQEHPLAGTIDKALDDLAETQTFAVASGLAVDMAAPGFAELADKDLRGAYRSVVADFASPRETLTAVRARFGEDKMNQGLDFLMTVLGNELSSAGPSVEKSQLKALTGDLAMVRVLGLVHACCAGVLERLDKAHGVKSRMETERLLDALLAARDNQYVGSRDFQGLAQQAGTPDTEREVLFLQDLLQGLRDLPDLFYDSHEARQRLQGALQSAVYDAVRREEDELGF
ncbi:MAG: type III secretion system gatekeeper subunit SctW [Desulfovibrionaceae bacterium]|nr:type III secretion system gatekeeper subunit SctW [Desulfovibrionaceae bacterium]